MANILDKNLFNREMEAVADYYIQQCKNAVSRLEDYIVKNGIDPNDMSNEAAQNLLFAKNELAAYQQAKETGNYVALFPEKDQTKLKNGFAGISQSGLDWKEKHLNQDYLRDYLSDHRVSPITYTQTNQGVVRGGLNPGSTATTNEKKTVNKSAEDIIDFSTPAPSEPAPEPAAAKPAATAGGGQTGRVTAAMKPAEFKPKYLEEIEPKSEEEYLGKDPNNWKTMSKAEKAAKAIGFIGDIGGDVIDTIAAGYGLENGGAKRLREAREKLQRDKEERQAQYRDYVNKIEAENRRIREFNAGIGNQLAFQQFQAENEYNRQLNLLNEQARLQRENGLYNTPL